MSIELVMPISSSVIHFSCFQSFSASGSLPVSQFFTSGGQRLGALASISVLPMNSQDWFPLWLTGLISLQSKGLSGVFSNTAIQKHQEGGGRSQDGGGVGQGEHFLPHKFIKRAFKHQVNSTKQLLNASRGHQAPRKATQLFERR